MYISFKIFLPTCCEVANKDTTFLEGTAGVNEPRYISSRIGTRTSRMNIHRSGASLLNIFLGILKNAHKHPLLCS